MLDRTKMAGRVSEMLMVYGHWHPVVEQSEGHVVYRMASRQNIGTVGLTQRLAFTEEPTWKPKLRKWI
jgi:hypothetical protein